MSGQIAVADRRYAVYDILDKIPGITHYGCWAHARRYFVKAYDREPERAEYVLSMIRELYRVEHFLRENCEDPDERRVVRQYCSVPVLQELKQWLEDNPGPPNSRWGKAVNYTLKRWKKLSRYTDDGTIEIDNNLVENAIRPIAVGRKGYLFAGSHEAARAAAVFYAFIGTCKQQGIDPSRWLVDVLQRIPGLPEEELPTLLPHRWKGLQTTGPP